MQPITSTLPTAGDETSGNILPEATDAPDQTPEVEPPAKLPAIDRVWNYFRKRFNEEDWFGSTILLSYIYRDYNNVRAAQARLVNGEKKPDNIRTFNYASSIGINGISFLSQRQGKMPEGNTYLQRLQSTVRHPGQSLPHFEYLLNLPGVSMGVYKNARTGLKAHGIGLAPGETPYAPEKVRLYESILITAAALLSGHGLFRKKREMPQSTKEEADISEVKRTIRKIWRYDRTLLAGSALSTSIPLLYAVEGWQKSSKSRKEAFFLLRGTAVGMTAVAAYYFYVFQRIVKSNFGKKTDNTAQGQEELPAKEQPPKGGIDKTWDYLKSRFTRDNFFGSLVIPLSIQEPLRNLKMAQNRMINGTLRPDTARILSNRIYIAERSWSFFSARGALFPEGKHIWQRVGNVIRHPQRSSTQFEYLLLLPSRLLTAYTHTKAGLEAYGLGRQQQDKKYQGRLYIGAMQALWISFLGYGHFKRRQPFPLQADEAAKADSHLNNKNEPAVSARENMSMLDIIRTIWKQDRILALGYILDMIFPITGAHARWRFAGKNPADATHYAKEAISGATASAAYGLYTFQRIAKSNFYDTGTAQADTLKFQEETQETDRNEDKATGRFTTKIAEQKKAETVSDDSSSKSFAERLSATSDHEGLVHP